MVVEVESGAEQMTNDFRFTWAAAQNGEKSIPLVVPKTYRGTCSLIVIPSMELTFAFSEAMKWLEGRRALEISASIRRLRAAP